MTEGADRAPVLVVEDYEPVAELERRVLVRSGFKVRVVGRISEALKLLKEGPFAAVLLDYQLPDGDPWDVVALARARVPRIPVVLVTAMGNELVAANALHRGVAEYIRKVGTFYEELANVVARVMKLAQAEERMLRSNALFAAMLDAMPDLVLRLSADGTVRDCRAHSKSELSTSPEKLIGGNVRQLLPSALVDECLHHVRAALDAGVAQRWEYQLPAPNGPRDHEARFVPGGADDVVAIIKALPRGR